MHYLAGVDTVHTAASICDYLVPRVGPDDAVTVVGVASPEPDERRDREEALSVVRVRLVDPDVETTIREGRPADELLAAASERDVDEVVVGSRGGTAESTADLGSTARAVLERADRPVVVVPGPALSESDA